MWRKNQGCQHLTFTPEFVEIVVSGFKLWYSFSALMMAGAGASCFDSASSIAKSFSSNERFAVNVSRDLWCGSRRSHRHRCAKQSNDAAIVDGCVSIVISSLL